MKTCKFCQEELAENVKFCPNCGKPVSEEEAAAPAETAEQLQQTDIPEEAPAQEAAAEGEEAAEGETAQESEQPQKKATPGKIALAAAAVVVLAGILIALIVSGLGGGKEAAQPTEGAQETVAAVEATVPADGNPEDVTCKGTYTVSDEEALAARETVVATIGDSKLTNGELQAYYWSVVNSYLNSEFGYSLMMYGLLDYTQPLDVQISIENEGYTWQQYFLDEALTCWKLNVALAQEAAKAGFGISEADQTYLDNLTASLEQTAASYGMTVEELMRNYIGPGGILEDFVAFQKLYCEGRDYYQTEMDKLVPTQEQLEQFYTDNAATFEQSGITKDSRYVDVRHILIQVEGGTADETGATTYTDEEWAACEAEAQAVLDKWLAGEKTEESFAALANEVSEDPGSNTNGGLYENVYKGQMVEPFETWCFDESRAYGDSGLVKTSYGYHVMFYVGSELMWPSYAEDGWFTEQSSAFLEKATSGYTMDVQYEDIVLGFINLAG